VASSNPVPYKRGRTYASLASLNTQFPGGPTNGNSAAGPIIINFPCMPESLELARQSAYNPTTSMVTPDGFHIYDHTDPLRIPLKFSLASVDTDYVGEDGAYALVYIAASLHALVMPVGNSSTTAQASSLPATNGSEASMVANANSLSTSGQSSTTNTSAGNAAGLYFPPACLLAIMMATNMPGGRPNMGVNCTGFVERVSVTFRGPWLQGTFDESAPLRNLPSFADYEFVFVHQPGYTNNFPALSTAANAAANSGAPAPGIIQATTAQDIFSSFYLENRTGASQTTYADIFGNTTPPAGNSP
jgi:hypothetical protein